MEALNAFEAYLQEQDCAALTIRGYLATWNTLRCGSDKPTENP